MKLFKTILAISFENSNGMYVELKNESVENYLRYRSRFCSKSDHINSFRTLQTLKNFHKKKPAITRIAGFFTFMKNYKLAFAESVYIHLRIRETDSVFVKFFLHILLHIKVCIPVVFAFYEWSSIQVN